MLGCRGFSCIRNFTTRWQYIFTQFTMNRDVVTLPQPTSSLWLKRKFFLCIWSQWSILHSLLRTDNKVTWRWPQSVCLSGWHILMSFEEIHSVFLSSSQHLHQSSRLHTRVLECHGPTVRTLLGCRQRGRMVCVKAVVVRYNSTQVNESKVWTNDQKPLLLALIYCLCMSSIQKPSASTLLLKRLSIDSTWNCIHGNTSSRYPTSSNLTRPQPRACVDGIQSSFDKPCHGSGDFNHN